MQNIQNFTDSPAKFELPSDDGDEPKAESVMNIIAPQVPYGSDNDPSA
jgi:hypothetical protein